MNVDVRLTALAGLVVGAGLIGCSDAAAPRKQPPAPLTIPAFVFVADAGGEGGGGTSQLFRFRNDSVVRLTSDSSNDAEPRSAAGRIVFTSDRDGNVEVYLTDLDAGTQRRVTNNGATDEEPALSPRGDTIAFVSNRSGISRLWLIAAPSLTSTSYDSAVALETGSSGYIPEDSPVWSPDGTQIAFVSTRMGASQVFVVASSGGAAVQVTHESGGAFAPAWSGDGKSIVYVSATGAPAVHRAVLATGVTTAFASDSLGVADPSCNTALCLATTDPFGNGGDIIAVPAGGGAPQLVLPRANHERRPTILVP